MSGPYRGCFACGWCIHITQARDYKFCPKCGSRLGTAQDTRDFDPREPGLAQAAALLRKAGFKVEPPGKD